MYGELNKLWGFYFSQAIHSIAARFILSFNPFLSEATYLSYNEMMNLFLLKEQSAPS